MESLLKNPSTGDQRIRALIAAARQAAERGKPQDAAPLIRQAEKEAPRHPLVLNESASRMLGSGNASGALALLEQVVRAEPDNTDILFNLAAALRKHDRVDEAVEILDRLLAIDGRNVAALLEKASLEELQCKPRAAAMSYRAALQMIPPGFRPPPAFDERPAAREGSRRGNNRALETYIAEGLEHVRARHKDEPLGRFDQCVDTMLQKRRVFRQQPTFMFFPELPAIEFYERASFPFLDRIESGGGRHPRRIARRALRRDRGARPVRALSGGMPMEQWRELNDSRRWGVYSLWREGKAYPEHIARMSQDRRGARGYPALGYSGQRTDGLVLHSRRQDPDPGAHRPVNTRLVVHLPLIVPPGCGFRVGGQQREWVPGKAFVFDDSINHEAWNDSDVPRAVLIFDIWSPYLSAAERDLARALTVRIGEYYGTLSNSRGM